MIKKEQIVNIADYEGWNLSWNLNIFSGPMFSLKCGQCGHTWQQRLPLIDEPLLSCPHCRVLNRIPLGYAVGG